MKTPLLSVIALLLALLCGFVSPLNRPSDELSVVVRDVELKVVKCQGELSTKSVNVECLVTNKGEFDTQKSRFSSLTLVDNEGNAYNPLGRYTAYFFGGYNGYYQLKSGIPMKTSFVVKRVSSKITSFAQLSVKYNGTPMDINNIPIVWK